MSKIAKFAMTVKMKVLKLLTTKNEKHVRYRGVKKKV